MTALANVNVLTMPSRHPAIEFINTIFSPEDRICIVMIPTKGDVLVRFRQASKFSIKSVEQLTAYNEQGYGIFVSMSAFRADTDERT